MLRQDFERALGRAICDASFCARLLSDPADALTDYGLGTDEAIALDGLRAHSLSELTTQILRLINQAVGEFKFTW